MATELKLPDVGDNIEQGTVVTVLVKPGDTVTEGQPIIEIETDKAVVEVPASEGGTVENIGVKVGDTVAVGGTILTLAGGDATPAAGAPSSPAPSAPAAEPGAPTTASSPDTANRVAQAQVDAQKAQTGPAPSSPADGTEVKLPDVGDNIEQGTVVNVLVKPGDTVSEGQPIIEIETDKAVVEVPSSAAGTVGEVRVNVGDTVAVGGTILTLAGGASENAPAPGTPEDVARRDDPPSGAGSGAGMSGQGAEVDESTDVASDPNTANRVAQAQVEAQKEQASTPAPAVAPAAPPQPQTFDGRQVIAASPSVRRLARELGVDIATVHGTGTAGRIGEDDVRRQAAAPQPQAQPQPQAAPAPRPAPAAPPAPAQPAPAPAAPLPNFERFGPVRREDMSGIRKATIRSMTTSWTTIPMVTHFDKADVTRMEETRKAFGARVEKAGGKLTMTHILMKVVANALRRYPKFNASLDLDHQQVVYKEYVNLGVAVDTPQGLLVPVLKDADRKSITEIVLELGELAGRARERKLKPDEMQGASFTISNLGGIGGYAFTPIVNAPEVAILGVSRGGFEPVWNKETGSFEPRNMLPLSLTYDHRLIDGADAARFVRAICEMLEDPFLITL